MNEPSVYCSTYSKYSNGSIAGAWISLEGLDQDSFYEKCKELHKSESDPEFMFQDFEHFPEEFYCESGLDDRIWEWLTKSESEREVWEAALNFDSSIEFKDAQDRFLGCADSVKDYAWEWLQETGEWESLPEFAQRYFDLDAYARDLEIELYVAKLNGKVWIFNY